MKFLNKLLVLATIVTPVISHADVITYTNNTPVPLDFSITSQDCVNYDGSNHNFHLDPGGYHETAISGQGGPRCGGFSGDGHQWLEYTGYYNYNGQQILGKFHYDRHVDKDPTGTVDYNPTQAVPVDPNGYYFLFNFKQTVTQRGDGSQQVNFVITAAQS